MKPLLLSLAHSLWQGAVLWVSLSAALRLLPARAANARYTLGAGALALTVMAWVVTWAWLAREPLTVSVMPPVSLSAVGEEIPNNKIQIPRKFQITNSKSQNSDSASAAAVWNLKFGAWDFLGIWDLKFGIFSFWLLGVSGGFWRMASSLSAARKVSGSAATVAEPLWLAEFSRLRETLTVSGQIALRSSAKILSPCVAGLWRPVILIPASLLTNTPPEMLRAILAHELAHIRRRDWLVNLFQLTAEALLFFNPFVWLLSHSVRREREACCDLIASAACAGPAAYSDALLWCARHNNHAPLTLTAAPAFAADGQRLRDRVTRVLFPAQIPKGRARWSAALAIALAVAAVFAALTVSVRATVNKLTDSERVSAVVQAAKDNGDVHPFKSYDGNKPFNVSVMLVTEDGAASAYFSAGGHSMAESVTSSFNTSGTSNPAPLPHAIRGKLRLAGWADGYAPACTDTIYPDPDSAEITERITLPKGFLGVVRFVDEQGAPVTGVQCQLQFSRHKIVLSFPAKKKPVSNSDGTVVFRNVEKSADYKLAYVKSGFQWDIVSELQFSPDQPLIVTLLPSRTVSGLVTDSETGKPLAGVRGHYSGTGNLVFYFNQPLTVSGSDGRFAIDGLNARMEHKLKLFTDGYRTAEIILAAGQTEFTANLSKATGFSLDGMVSGLQSLPESHWDNHKILRAYSADGKFYQSVVMSGGKDTDQSPLHLKDLPAGPLALSWGNYYTQLNLSGDVKDFVWNLSATAPRFVEKNVRIKIVTDNPAIVPDGTLQIVTSHNDPFRVPPVTVGGRLRELSLRDGVVQLFVTAPGQVTVSGEKIAGFYFDRQTFTISGTDSEPVNLVIHAKPAGAIHGKTFDADGQLYRPAEQYIIYSPPEKSGEWVVKTFGDSDTPALGAGHFLIPSLPLNVSYRILLQDQCNFTLSKPLTLTDRQPVRQVELQRKRGVDFTGKIVTAGGQLPKNFYFEFFPNNSRSGRNRVIPVAADGHFVIPDVNFDIDGNYQLNFDNQFWIKINRRSPQPLTVRLP